MARGRGRDRGRPMGRVGVGGKARGGAMSKGQVSFW